MSEPQAHESGKGSKGEDKAKAARAERAAHTREQMLLLTSASFCTKPHNVRPPRAPSASPALEERRRAAAELSFDGIEGDRRCEECQQKLSAMAAALVLAVLPPTPTPALLAAAKTLRSEQPMVWSAIRRANPVLLAQMLRRSRKEHFEPSEYQAMASEAIAALSARAA